MKPRTLRENILIHSALKLLNEANVVPLDNGAKTAAETLCPVEFAGKKDDKSMAARKSEDPSEPDSEYKGPVSDKTAMEGLKKNYDNWATIGKYNDAKWQQKMRHSSIVNADIGTFTEYFAGEYLYQRFLAAGFTGVELHAQGNHQNPGPGSAMKVIKDQYYRRVDSASGKIGYTLQLMEDYREYGFGQGELAWKAMESKLTSAEGAKYAKANGRVKIMLVGSSSANVGSPGLLAQEDMQILFPDDGNPITGNAGETTDNVLSFSNKSGGSNPRQINKTASSVGLCTPAQLKQALKDLKRTKGGKPGIVESSVDMFLKLNENVTAYWNDDSSTEELKCYQYLYKSAYDNKKGQTRGSAEEYDKIEWDKLSADDIKNLLYGIVDGIFDRSTKAFNPPPEDKAGCMKKSGNKTFTSFSTCVTTVLGRMGGAIAMGALKGSNITTSDQFYDMLILGTNPGQRNTASSILGTMYPSIFEMVLDMHTGKDKAGKANSHQGKNYTRAQIASAIKDRLDGINGRYWSVNETHESAEPMEDVHAGFRGMIECVAEGKGGDFKIISSNDAGKGDSNSSYFVYDCAGVYHTFMTITLRKNSGSNYSLGGATLNNINELVSVAEADDTEDGPEETAQKLGEIEGSLEQTDGKIDIPSDASGESVTDGDVSAGQPHGDPHTDDLSTSVKKLVDDGADNASEAAGDELKAIKSELIATIDKAQQTSVDPDIMTTRSIQDQLLAAIPDHDTNPKVSALVTQFGFNSLSTFNSQRIGTQKEFIKALVATLPDEKLKALHAKLIKENSRRRSMNRTYLDLIRETVSFVIREADDAQLVDTFVEDLFNADPEKAGEVMSIIAVDVAKELENAELPDEEQDPTVEQEKSISERWLKLAGLLQG